MDSTFFFNITKINVFFCFFFNLNKLSQFRNSQDLSYIPTMSIEPANNILCAIHQIMRAHQLWILLLNEIP